MVDEKYTYYANAVINGDIVACKYIKQACERYLSFFEKYTFNESAVDKVANFCGKLRHYTGKTAGQKFILSPFQFWIVCAVFGFYKDGHRVCKNVYIEMARKQGKSFFAGAIALYMLIADGEKSAEVEFCANSAKQAGILFSMASNMCEGIDPKKKYFKRYRDKIKFDYTKSFLQVLSTDANNNDGWNSSCYIVDEYHSAQNADMYNVLKSSQGMRENPLSIVITTAGFNLFSPCYQMRTTCTEILSGAKTDDTQFAAIYTLDADDDWKDENVWIKSNPNLDITVKREYLREQVTQAENQTSLEVGVRTKNFNQWLSSNDIWISNQTLLDCSQTITPNDFVNKYVYIGIDLAAVSDLTAVSMICKDDDIYKFYTRYYIPSEALKSGENAEKYKEWKRTNQLVVCPGNVTDYDYILNDILRWREMGIYIEQINYDSWNATSFAISATECNLPMIPFSQNIGNYNRPTKEFERNIKSGKVIIDNNEITRWCFSNVALKTDWNDNCKPIKAGDNNGKIDGVISMLTGFGGMIENISWNNTI